MKGSFINHSGKRSGRLIISDKHEWRGRDVYWLCDCDCGKQTWVRARSLKGGSGPHHTQSCGCLNREAVSKDYTGERSGLLVAVKRIPDPNVHGKTKYFCQCDCGNTCTISARNWKSGGTRSCGCLASASAKQRNIERFAHYRGKAAFNRVFKLYKAKAEDRGLAFELSEEVFREIATRPCTYCGIINSNVSAPVGNNGDFHYNGIDRWDNSQGYTIQNSVPCCERCNRAKLQMHPDEFR